MENAKLDDQLNLVLEIPEREFINSPELSAGYDREHGTWELIVRYAGNEQDFLTFAERFQAEVSILSGNFAIITMPKEQIAAFSKGDSVLYIEKAKNMVSFVQNGIRASCPVSPKGDYYANGTGVLVGIIDSGVDLLHSDFIRENGDSAFVEIWDQTSDLYYGQIQIQEAIDKKQQLMTDPTGHGTHVASIAAGNQGIASQAGIIFVKLGRSLEGELSRTTNVMRAVDFLIKKAEERNQPVAINLSYGTNYGDHLGGSLLEMYMNQAANLWKTCICVGTGNEGDTARHKQGQLTENQTEVIEISVAPLESSWNLQIWKEYADRFHIEIRSPAGTEQRLEEQGEFTRKVFEQAEMVAFWEMPTPYHQKQEIFLQFLSKDTAGNGIWTIFLIPDEIKEGTYAMWLPVSGTTSTNTRFLTPDTELTLTIPSGAGSVISVGAYDSDRGTYAVFSGRGIDGSIIKKPDLAAPGVNIVAAAPGGGQSSKSGTSMAVPFVTGATALLMEWGIIQGHDPYLYGEKVKAYLQRGAKTLPGFSKYPNIQVGYGALCIKESFP